ncbi:MAG TPA: FkbM family methyltransferase [Burkholderiales bacterium]|nr:FkbM family methyltransferase [Burkholderiales bacterium]
MLGALLRSLWARPGRGAAAVPQVRPAPGAAGFVRELAALVASRIDAREGDNFDHDRWPGALRARSVVRAQYFAAATLDDLGQRAHELAGACGLLADATSRDWFRQLLAYRILGHERVRLPSNTASHWEARERAKRLSAGPSPFVGMFGPLARYALEFEGERIALDCSWGNVAWTMFLRQYYFARDGVRIAPAPGDHVIDAGTCYGDTALAFAASVGPQGRVHGFEIDPDNIAIARHNFSANPALAARLRLHEAALGPVQGKLFRHGSGPGARVSAEPSAHEVRVTSIDRMFDSGEIEKVDFIKMDIEGAELAALRGAQETLRRFRPRLAISVYHQPDDLWRIPAWLDQLGAGYRFHLEHYTIHHEETVLYAQASSSPAQRPVPYIAEDLK